MQKIINEAWENALNIESFLSKIKSLHSQGKVTGSTQTPELLEYSLLNEKRMERILKHNSIHSNLLPHQTSRWMVITEGWCGDSAQILPYLHKFADLQRTELKVVLRDEQDELMNLFLTNGTRSIPIVVFMNENNEVRHQWGPRPSILAEWVKKWKAEGLTKEEFNPLIHKWYADDKGETCIKEWESLLQ
jgi:hypothetical protein